MPAKVKEQPKETRLVIPEKPPFGVTLAWGKRKVGKTLFALNSPWLPVHIIDTEDSAADYEQHMNRLLDMSTLKNEFTRSVCYEWNDFTKAVTEILASETKYGTIIIDTSGQVTEWIKTDTFQSAGTEKATKMGQVVWGDVRNRIRNMLLKLMKQSNLVILTAHEREYNGVQSPRCNPALLELASLSIQLTKNPNQQVPDGVIDVARLPFFPPRIPQITIEKLLPYVDKPADYENLPEEEKAPEVEVYIPEDTEMP